MDAPAAAPPLPEQLLPLLGVWEGEGSGHWGGVSFTYRERTSFRCDGKPFLVYEQVTADLQQGTPMHAERGYWRAGTDDGVELVLAHPLGVTEIAAGRWIAGHLRLRSLEVRRTPSAKPVTALEREYELDGERLRYHLWMAVEGGELLPHLGAELRRGAG